MKTLFDVERATEVKERMGKLRPETERLWGQMNAAQALAHCAGSMEMALGDQKLKRIFIGRILGGFVKGKVMANDEPLRKNSPTMRELVMVKEERNLEVERVRLTGLIERCVAAGPGGCTDHPHSFFGKLSGQEWGILMYKHVDHHLRQFGV